LLLQWLLKGKKSVLQKTGRKRKGAGGESPGREGGLGIGLHEFYERGGKGTL